MIIRFLFILILTISHFATLAQNSFEVAGDGDKYYPVLFSDYGWAQHRAMELEIGRSNVHKVEWDWWGSLIARFRFHINGWGHGSDFIDAEIRSYSGQTSTFIAGWYDATTAGGTDIIIWLRGATTYYYSSDFTVTAMVFDNVHQALPYVDPANVQHSYLTEVQPYVNNRGISSDGTAYFRGAGVNYFQGSLGVGTKPAAKFHLSGGGYTNEVATMNQNSTARIDVANPAISIGFGYNLRDEPLIQAYNNVVNAPVNLQLNPYGGSVAIGTTVAHGYKLAVAGGILAEKVKVKMQSAWPDYVFRPGYVLRSVEDLERFVAQHHHLPDMPSEKEVKESGVDVGEMNAKLLKALEEQALYIIELHRKLGALEEKVGRLDSRMPY